MSRGGWVAVVGVVVGVAASSALPARGQVTRVATFENYAAGQAFQPSFTDSLSGITFRNSTLPPGGGFVIDGDADGSYFGGGNYLTSGIGPNNGLGFDFGFTADLPAPASRVRLDAVYHADSVTHVVLQGFDAGGTLVAQQAGQAGMVNPFTLEIDSAQYDIKSFRVSVGGGAAGYDNIRYTVLPEPGVAGMIYLAVPLLITSQRRRACVKCI